MGQESDLGFLYPVVINDGPGSELEAKILTKRYTHSN